MKSEHQNRISVTIATAVGSAVLLWGSLATAGPASVAGNWNVVGNNSTGVLSISQGANSGICKPITGSIFGLANSVEGYYCPSDRRIVFARKLSNGVPFQFYEGYVALNGLRMAGTFSIWNPSGGDAVNQGPDYNFSASK